MRPDAKGRAAPGRPAQPSLTSAAAKRAEVTSTVHGGRDNAPNLRIGKTLPHDQVRRLANLVRTTGTAAGELVAERRKLVLAHPDLAVRLTEEPIGYERPEQWTGYVPPLIWNGELNDSARRAALAEICAEALRRYGGDCPALDVT